VVTNLKNDLFEIIWKGAYKMAKPYHHGNLREELIERGIEYIDEKGIEELSMRALAKMCDVSSAAPYAHFRNKEEFLEAVKVYITDKFSGCLKSTIEKNKDRSSLLVELGVSYVVFFYDRPSYFSFLFNHGRIVPEDYEPYLIFKGSAKDVMGDLYSEDKLIALWAMVHGLSQLSYAAGVIDGKNIEKKIAGILTSVQVL